jgi:hypothetical protein
MPRTEDFDEDIQYTDPRKKVQTFTCNDCGSHGSIRWMQRHDCSTNQDLLANGGRCEDYPACGHTDGDGCIMLESHTSEYWTDWITSRIDAGYDMDDPDFYPGDDF